MGINSGTTYLTYTRVIFDEPEGAFEIFSFRIGVVMALDPISFVYEDCSGIIHDRIRTSIQNVLTQIELKFKCHLQVNKVNTPSGGRDRRLE